MATVTAFVRTSSKTKKEVVVRLRLGFGRRGQIFYRTDLLVNPFVWDNKTGHIKTRIKYDELERCRINNAIDRYEVAFMNVFNKTENKESLKDAALLATLMDKELHPEKYKETKKKEARYKDLDFYELFDKFMAYKNYPWSHAKDYWVLKRLLLRFEVYETIAHNTSFKITLKVCRMTSWSI